MIRPSMLLQVRPKLIFLYILRTSSALATSESSHAHHKHSISPNTSSSPSLVGHIALRVATRTDVPAIQRCNLATLPENYSSAFYVSHLRRWPDLALVAEHVLPDPNSHSNSSSKRNPFDSFDASKPQSEIVGYVLGKVEETPITRSSSTSSSFFTKSTVSETDEYFNNYNERPKTTEMMGHVTSLAVLPTHRRMGLAAQMMEQLHFHMNEATEAAGVGLHVRVSNIAARRLYCEGMGYNVEDVIRGYYQDGEDAFFMRKNFAKRYQDNGENEIEDELRNFDDNDNFDSNVNGGGSNLGRFSLSRMRKSRRRSSNSGFVWECGPEELRLPRIIVVEQAQEQEGRMGNANDNIGTLPSQGDASTHVMTGRL